MTVPATLPQPQILYSCQPGRGEPGLSLLSMDWETAFFGRSFAKLEMTPPYSSHLDPVALDAALERLLSYADDRKITVLELRLDASLLGYASAFEKNGFRLVDTLVSFLSLIDKGRIHPDPARDAGLRSATGSDLGLILHLTREAFSRNPVFYSRFKNPSYFTAAEHERYYAAWITNNFGTPRTYCAVLVNNEDKTAGFILYKRTGEHAGLPLYKGLLAAVDPGHRREGSHLLMQDYLFRQFPDDLFYVEIVTQLSNYPAVKNHIKAQRSLHQVEFIFYRSRPVVSSD